MSIEVGDKLCNIFNGNKTKTLSCSSHVFMNWNDLVEWHNGINKYMCRTCCTNICYAFKNVVPNFLIHSNIFVCSCWHFCKTYYISFITHLSPFVNQEIQHATTTYGFNMYYCPNPSLGLATKARLVKGEGQEWSLESHFMFSWDWKYGKVWGVNLHTPKWTPTLGIRVPMDSRISKKLL